MTETRIPYEAGPRRHKYGAKAAVCSAGHKHPSRKEARRCQELHLLQRAGAISGLEVQPFYPFVINGVELKHDNGRRIGIQIDFAYRDAAGKMVCEDTKGVRVRDWPLRAAIFRVLYPDMKLIEL